MITHVCANYGKNIFAHKGWIKVPQDIGAHNCVCVRACMYVLPYQLLFFPFLSQTGENPKELIIAFGEDSKE